MGDPQTQLQEDKDPMLILHSSYLDSGGDLHPDGDLGTGPCPLLLLLGGTDMHWRSPLGFASPSRGRRAGFSPFPTA